MKYEFHIEPLPSESIDATVERFNALGANGWRSAGKYALNHMLFERTIEPVAVPAVESPVTAWPQGTALCYICRTPQFMTGHGVTCGNRHDGAGTAS